MFVFVAIISTLLGASATTIYPSNGTCSVDHASHHLVDHSRQDPFAAAEGRKEARSVMISSFFPVGRLDQCDPYKKPYMPPATAKAYDDMYGSYGLPNGTFASMELSLCRNRDHLPASSPFPTVLSSPGFGNSRHIHNSLAQSLASQGFVVITIDHTYDANIVEYPDGSYVLAKDTSDQFDLLTRRQDASFIMDCLQSPSGKREILGDWAGHVDFHTDSFEMFGHSLGGATAVATEHLDRRVISAINMDGSLFGPALAHGLRCPVLLFGREGKNLTSDESWLHTWDHSKNTTRVALTVPGAVHGSFTDFPKLADALPLSPELKDELVPLLGTVSGAETEAILVAFITSFFDFSIGRSDSPLPHDVEDFEVDVLQVLEDGYCG